MRRRRRPVNLFNLTFLDAMTCGLGAVILLYLIINGSVETKKQEVTGTLQAEVDEMEQRVQEARSQLVEVRNAVRMADRERTVTRGLSRRLLETLEETREELATFELETTAQREQLDSLKTELKNLEARTERLSAEVVSDETPGTELRAHVGDGDRQYLTGLKVGGARILVLLDSSASMLDETVVNVIRHRNLPDDRKRLSPKWQSAVATMRWLTTQIPRDAYFQVYRFAEDAGPVAPELDRGWLSADDARTLGTVMTAIEEMVPEGGTSLHFAFGAIQGLDPPPDNIILLTDGLPTMDTTRGSRNTVTAKRRLRLFNAARDRLPKGIPVNIVLFPMEGDPMAATAFWKLAMRTRGSFLSPSEDWP